MLKNKKSISIGSVQRLAMGPMDGVGAAIKMKMDDILAFCPDDVIKCTDDLVEHFPESDIPITTYTKSKSNNDPHQDAKK